MRLGAFSFCGAFVVPERAASPLVGADQNEGNDNQNRDTGVEEPFHARHSKNKTAPVRF